MNALRKQAGQLAATSADLLVRVKSNRTLPVLCRYRDGSILGGRVLRARSLAGIAREVYALLTCYQILRIAITDAVEADGGIDPDRGGFTIALNAARDLLTQAAHVIAGTVIDLIGTIGRRVLDNLLPDRRLRVSPASSNAPFPNTRPEGPNINRRSYKDTLEINILTAGP
jgi:hypothetical protein